MSDSEQNIINRLGQCDFLQWCIDEAEAKDSVSGTKFPSYYVPSKTVSAQ